MGVKRGREQWSLESQVWGLSQLPFSGGAEEEACRGVYSRSSLSYRRALGLNEVETENEGHGGLHSDDRVIETEWAGTQGFCIGSRYLYKSVRLWGYPTGLHSFRRKEAGLSLVDTKHLVRAPLLASAQPAHLPPGFPAEGYVPLAVFPPFSLPY